MERIDKDRSKAEQESEQLQGTTELQKALDDELTYCFENNPNLSLGVAETIRAYKKENHKHLQRIKELEYQISELWAEDADTSARESFEYLDDDEVRTRYFLSHEEYNSLSESDRNQKALDNYLKRNHSKAHIGKMYERYIGYLFEKEGYRVEYRGIEKGLSDGGIDLICRKNGKTLLVQCKCWKQDSTIYEKHICQLYGASKFYDKKHPKRARQEGTTQQADDDGVTPVFISTTELHKHAIEVAKTLGVEIAHIIFDKTYPMIKCNINKNGEKIYHLPIDEMYDYTKISKPGETYVTTVKEAEALGFRRAFRWSGKS